MGRKRRKPKPKHMRPFRFTDAEHNAIRWCAARGLWMLVEKDHYGRLWTVYSTSTGRNVGMYRPATGTCLYRGRDAVVPHWRTALALMASGDGV
jgi:hypothetical protein